jgi:hypothetical protein
MDKNYFPIRVVRECQKNWIYSDIETESERDSNNMEWKEFSEKISIHSCHVIVISILDLERLNDDAILILTKGSRQCFNLPVLNKWRGIIEVNEFIDLNGGVVEPLEELEINKILRIVFELKPKQIFISLLNSIKNNIHERVLRNVLLVPGYKCRLSSELIKKIIIE